MYVYTHFQSGSRIRHRSSTSSRRGQPASALHINNNFFLFYWVFSPDTPFLWHMYSLLTPSARHPDLEQAQFVNICMCFTYLLCSFKCFLKVGSAIVWVKCAVVEPVGTEPVHQSTESQTVRPTGWEVLYTHTLQTQPGRDSVKRRVPKLFWIFIYCLAYLNICITKTPTILTSSGLWINDTCIQTKHP